MRATNHPLSDPSASSEFETAIVNLRNMTGIVTTLLEAAFGESHEKVTGHPDAFHFTAAEREQILFAAYYTEDMARALEGKFLQMGEAS